MFAGAAASESIPDMSCSTKTQETLNFSTEVYHMNVYDVGNSLFVSYCITHFIEA